MEDPLYVRIQGEPDEYRKELVERANRRDFERKERDAEQRRAPKANIVNRGFEDRRSMGARAAARGRRNSPVEVWSIELIIMSGSRPVVGRSFWTRYFRSLGGCSGTRRTGRAEWTQEDGVHTSRGRFLYVD